MTENGNSIQIISFDADELVLPSVNSEYNTVVRSPGETFKPSTISSDRTVVRQFVEYLRLSNFDIPDMLNIDLSHDKNDMIIFDDLSRNVSYPNIDKLTSDFFSKYRMGGVQGESEVKVTTLECRWSGLRRQFSMKGVYLNRSNSPLTYSTMSSRRKYLNDQQRYQENHDKIRNIQKNSHILEADTMKLADFFQKYYKKSPEVLSCLVQFIVMHHLQYYSSKDIENLKFGDFIYHNDEDGEYFVASQRLEKHFAAQKKTPWIIKQKSPKDSCHFPCPVKVLKFYMSRQETNLIEKPDNLAIMALILQPKNDIPSENGQWYSTQYFKPKSALSNIFNRVMFAASNLRYSLSIGTWDNSFVTKMINSCALCEGPNDYDSRIISLEKKFVKYQNASESERNIMYDSRSLRLDPQFKIPDSFETNPCLTISSSDGRDSDVKIEDNSEMEVQSQEVHSTKVQTSIEPSEPKKRRIEVVESSTQNSTDSQGLSQVNSWLMRKVDELQEEVKNLQVENQRFRERDFEYRIKEARNEANHNL